MSFTDRFLGFSVYATSNSSSLNSGTMYQLDNTILDTVEYDTIDCLNSSHQFVCPAKGIWWFGACINMSAMADHSEVEICLYKDNSLYIPLRKITKAGSWQNAINGSCVARLLDGDVIDLRFKQSSGSSETIVYSSTNNVNNSPTLYSWWQGFYLGDITGG